MKTILFALILGLCTYGEASAQKRSKSGNQPKKETYVPLYSHSGTLSYWDSGYDKTQTQTFEMKLTEKEEKKFQSLSNSSNSIEQDNYIKRLLNDKCEDGDRDNIPEWLYNRNRGVCYKVVKVTAF